MGSNPTSTAGALGAALSLHCATRGGKHGSESRLAGPPEKRLPEPQSTAFFLLMMAVFGALMWWLAVARQVVFRVLAACLAFIPAMIFGIAAVNKYYDYYQNWNAAISDLTGSSAQAAELPDAASGGLVSFGSLLGSNIDTALAQQDGYTVRLTVHGAASHLTRAVYVYLPPQYFRPDYRDYKFPVIELIHGFPGQPQDWITVIGVNTILKSLVSAGQAQPAVLVMPDANGNRAVSLQCLNQVNGPQDATFLARDLPDYISRILRVQPPGRAWGIAGYSEGGFCAANLGLQYGSRYGYAGVLSGYFKPYDNQLAHPPRLVSPFGRNARAPAPQHPRGPAGIDAARHAGPAVLARHWRPGPCGHQKRRDIRAAGAVTAARRDIEGRARWRPHDVHLAGADAADAGVDDATAHDRGGPAGSSACCAQGSQARSDSAAVSRVGLPGCAIQSRLSRSGRWSRPRSSNGGASRAEGTAGMEPREGTAGKNRGDGAARSEPGQRRSAQLKHPDVQHGSLVQGGPQRPVQAIFQVKLPVPPDDVRK